jgi:puromycin-sensitive aminopeptidase
MTDHLAVNDHRLPRQVVPRRYELRIEPELDAGIFRGDERIEIEVLGTVESVVMNAVDLEITDAILALGWASAGDDLDVADAFSLGVEFDEPAGRVSFLTPSEELPPGRYTLSATFSGELNDRLCGFYRSVFTDESGAKRVIATTQFEETDARRAFPCFDEPDRKAVFSVTIDAPADMLALSNGPEISVEPLGGGKQRVRFGDTIAMSTYLVAFVVGPLEATAPIDVDGVALRVIHIPGKARLAAPALDAAVHALRYFSDYFGLPYPGSKLDLAGIPDFASGAMENLGCVTFREAILLADPATASRTEMERMIEVVDHEIAHMWFGDLVTMGWWNGIWLNEAFATFMALRCGDDYRPEWQIFDGFARSKTAALVVDGLHSTRPIEFPVESPDEVAAMFDVLTYQKGASVLWMLEQYIGTERFRSGVRRYLATHAYANTETHDLWEAIAAEASDVPIRALMESWIFQGGYPMIKASVIDDTVELDQTPFSYLPAPLPEPGGDESVRSSAIGGEWLAPVLARSSGGGDLERVILGASAERVSRRSGAFVVNAHGSGFYRVTYDAELRSLIGAHFGDLTARERYNVLADAWSNCVAGHTTLDEPFELFGLLNDERDATVWSVVFGAFGLLDLVIQESERPALREAACALFAPQLERVGWTSSKDEDPQTPVLRSSLITALGGLCEDPGVTARAHELFLADRAREARIDPEIAAAVLGVVAHSASPADVEAILDRFHRPIDPMDEVRNLYSLGRLSDPVLAGYVLPLCLSDIRSQNAPYLIASMLSNRPIALTSWLFVVEHFDEIVDRFPSNSIHRIFEGTTGLAEVDGSGVPLHRDSVRAFVGAHIDSGHRRLAAQSLERLEVNVRFAQRLIGYSLPAALARLTL